MAEITSLIFTIETFFYYLKYINSSNENQCLMLNLSIPIKQIYNNYYGCVKLKHLLTNLMTFYNFQDFFSM